MKLSGLSIFIINFMAIIFITGCSSDNKGIFVDDIVDGIRYINGVDESYTNDKGEFSYVGGKVEFYLGNIKIGELDHLPSDGKVFIQDLVGVDRTNISDEKVLKIATLLQSLDSDDTTDKIKILRKDFNKFYLMPQEDINNIEVNELLLEKGFSPKANMDVNKHLHNTLKYYEIIEDKQSLQLLSSSVKNGDINVPIDTNIVLNFNDDVRKSLVNKTNLILQDSSSNNIDFSITYDFDKITVKPLTHLESSNTYTLTIKSTLEDYGKNSLINDGGNNDIIIGFTTN